MELISREAALSMPFANGQYDHENADELFIFGCETYKEWLEQLPPIDAVPVVRCKDCKYFESEDDCDCPMDIRYSDFFCKMGERRGDGYS